MSPLRQHTVSGPACGHRSLRLSSAETQRMRQRCQVIRVVPERPGPGTEACILTLCNEHATREAIIAGFCEHLIKTEAGDVALFCYARRGSQEQLPPEFWHVEPDRLDETLVCYDSRRPVGMTWPTRSSPNWSTRWRPAGPTSSSSSTAATPDRARGTPTYNRPLPAKVRRVGSVAFSPDGKTLAAGYSVYGRGGGIGGVLLLDVDLCSWARLAGQIANSNFTCDEWRQYFPDEPYRRTFRELPWPSDLPQAERSQAEQEEKKLPSDEDSLRNAQAAAHSVPPGPTRRQSGRVNRHAGKINITWLPIPV